MAFESLLLQLWQQRRTTAAGVGLECREVISEILFMHSSRACGDPKEGAGVRSLRQERVQSSADHNHFFASRRTLLTKCDQIFQCISKWGAHDGNVTFLHHSSFP
mmetsp:Transcript_8300/g.30629  ORF Transcript_8300/g.30629 Transcript_8300/m.30629 type:complete len:105 (-) Transcript_8300:579-893(-)